MRRTKEQLEIIVKESYSISECLRKLNLRPVGGNFKTMKKYIKDFGLDTSHFTGQLWSKGKKLGASNRAKPLEEILVKDSSFTSSYSLKRRIIREGIKQWFCEECLGTEWNGQPIPLELEHCNGDNTDHRLENLKLLCPNCHAQTTFYRGRNKRSSRNEKRELNHVKFGETLTGNPELSLSNEESVETLRREPKSSTCREQPKTKTCECGTLILSSSLQCRECSYSTRKTIRPPYNQLLEDFENLKSFVQVGKKYGVSDNAVRKWLKVYQIDVDTVKRKSSARTEMASKDEV